MNLGKCVRNIQVIDDLRWNYECCCSVVNQTVLNLLTDDCRSVCPSLLEFCWCRLHITSALFI